MIGGTINIILIKQTDAPHINSIRIPLIEMQNTISQLLRLLIPPQIRQTLRLLYLVTRASGRLIQTPIHAIHHLPEVLLLVRLLRFRLVLFQNLQTLQFRVHIRRAFHVQFSDALDGILRGGQIAQGDGALQTAHVALDEGGVQLDGPAGVFQGRLVVVQHHVAGGTVAVVGGRVWAELDGFGVEGDGGTVLLDLVQLVAILFFQFC